MILSSHKWNFDHAHEMLLETNEHINSKPITMFCFSFSNTSTFLLSVVFLRKLIKAYNRTYLKKITEFTQTPQNFDTEKKQLFQVNIWCVYHKPIWYFSICCWILHWGNIKHSWQFRGGRKICNCYWNPFPFLLSL